MFAKNNLKKIILSLLLIVIIFTIFVFSAFQILGNSNQNQKFYGIHCQNGHAEKYRGACICDNPLSYSGKYCSEKALKSCQSNSDCPNKYYCLRRGEQGSCYKASVRNIYKSETKEYALSDSIISHYNVEAFCSALKKGYRPATRQDFDCYNQDNNCLNKDIMLNLQEKFGMEGAFWLDEIQNSNNAFFTDIGSGIVFQSVKNSDIAQVLCIREIKKIK